MAPEWRKVVAWFLHSFSPLVPEHSLQNSRAKIKAAGPYCELRRRETESISNAETCGILACCFKIEGKRRSKYAKINKTPAAETTANTARL